MSNKHINIAFILCLLIALATAPAPVVGSSIQAARAEAQPSILAIRRALLKRLENVSADRDDSEKKEAAVLLEIADLSIDNGLFTEGMSYAGATEEDTLPVELKRRRARLLAIATALDHLKTPDPKSWQQSFNDNQDWPMKRVYLSVVQARAGHYERALEILNPAIEEIADLPPAQFGAVLPPLLTAAVEVSDWATARAIVDRFVGVEHLRHSSALDYHLGLISWRHDEPVRAFDHFVEAAGHGDVWGHRARLALIELALQSGAASPEEAEQMLMRTYSYWRGSDESVVPLKSLKTLYLGRGDIVAALDILCLLYTSDAADDSVYV